MSEMIERVASALRGAGGLHNSADAAMMARATIEAMRDYLCSEDRPEALDDAWADVGDYGDHPVELYCNSRRLRAMFDAGLK